MPPSLERLAERVWLLPPERRGDRPGLAYLRGDRHALLVDAGNSPAHAEALRVGLRAAGLPDPDLLALTHWHWDHSFAMAAWALPSIAQEGTDEVLRSLAGRGDWSDAALEELRGLGLWSEESGRDLAEEYGTDRRSIGPLPPSIVYRDRLRLDLGGLSCQLEHVGGDHSPDCVFVFVPEEGILFVGDAFGPSVYGGPRRYSSANFLRLLERALRPEVRLVVESHGGALSREAFAADIEPWAIIARLARGLGADTAGIARELAAALAPRPLTEELLGAVRSFAAGAEG